MTKTKKLSERGEAGFRIIVLIVSGIVLWAWAYLTIVLLIINWLIALFADKRHKEIAEFCEYWNTQTYIFSKYLTGVSNERPFPFTNLQRIGKFQK